MSRILGALVLVATLAALGIWGATMRAGAVEDRIRAAAGAVAARHPHPLEIRVSGRDIFVTGVADSADDLAAIMGQLEAVPGRRAVDVTGVAILPLIDPYETALAKGTDGAVEARGYVPSAAARAALAAEGVPVDALPLGAGAPPAWAQAVAAGAAALAHLERGSFTLTGDTLTLEGRAATPSEADAARAALETADDFQTVVALEVAEPDGGDSTPE